VTPPESSAAEEIKREAPEGARVVEAFNTTFAGTLVEDDVGGQPLDVYVAGDDAETKEMV
jgi:predicted dinucleotide-binding enzyme